MATLYKYQSDVSEVYSIVNLPRSAVVISINKLLPRRYTLPVISLYLAGFIPPMKRNYAILNFVQARVNAVLYIKRLVSLLNYANDVRK